MRICCKFVALLVPLFNLVELICPNLKLLKQKDPFMANSPQKQPISISMNKEIYDTVDWIPS